MKKVLKVMAVLVLLAGWALAAAAVHVVRTEGPLPKIGKVTLVPKDRLTYRETYVDATGWTAEQVAEHPSLGRKLAKARARVEAESTSPVKAGVFVAGSRP